jgi:hypothetical protein
VSVRRIAWPVTGLILVVVVGFLVWKAAANGPDNVQSGRSDVLIGLSQVQVERSIGNGVYLATESPEPEIEVSDLGVEQPIDRTPAAAPKSFGRPAVLVGSNPAVDDAGFGDSRLFYYTDYADPWNRFLGLFGLGKRAMECLGSETDALCVSGAILNNGGPSAGSLVADDPAIPVVIQWLPLPPDTSIVVVIDTGGSPLLWQRPSGRLAHLAIPMDLGATVELKALDAQGQSLASESFTRCDFTDRSPQC